MDFDACEQQKRQLIIKVAILRRKEMGFQEENNITTLYDEMAPLLGIIVVPLDSRNANHLPSPAEMAKQMGKDWPSKSCPKCGKAAPLGSICQSCEDAKDENGNIVYKSGYLCDTRFGGCGFVDEKNGEWITQRLSKMGREIPTGTKESLGIMTKTDEGLK